MDRNLQDISESIRFIVKNMATKSDITDVKKDIADVKRDVADLKRNVADLPTKEDVQSIVYAELKDIRRQLEVLEESSKSYSGFAKEIDHVLQRVIAIEKHLGIQSRTVA